jgi:rare lipoprotein A
MRGRAALLVGLSGGLLGGCAHVAEGGGPGPRAPAASVEATYDAPPPRAEVQEGLATWYGAALAGRTTASGERFDPSKMTAAHKTLPFGTWVEVTRVDTGQTVRVRITDRGPFGSADRIVDLSRAAAAKIDLVKAGVTRVQLRVVDGPGE